MVEDDFGESGKAPPRAVARTTSSSTLEAGLRAGGGASSPTGLPVHVLLPSLKEMLENFTGQYELMKVRALASNPSQTLGQTL